MQALLMAACGVRLRRLGETGQRLISWELSQVYGRNARKQIPYASARSFSGMPRSSTQGCKIGCAPWRPYSTLYSFTNINFSSHHRHGTFHRQQSIENVRSIASTADIAELEEESMSGQNSNSNSNSNGNVKSLDDMDLESYFSEAFDQSEMGLKMLDPEKIEPFRKSLVEALDLLEKDESVVGSVGKSSTTDVSGSSNSEENEKLLDGGMDQMGASSSLQRNSDGVSGSGSGSDVGSELGFGSRGGGQSEFGSESNLRSGSGSQLGFRSELGQETGRGSSFRSRPPSESGSRSGSGSGSGSGSRSSREVGWGGAGNLRSDGKNGKVSGRPGWHQSGRVEEMAKDAFTSVFNNDGDAYSAGGGGAYFPSLDTLLDEENDPLSAASTLNNEPQFDMDPEVQFNVLDAEGQTEAQDVLGDHSGQSRKRGFDSSFGNSPREVDVKRHKSESKLLRDLVKNLEQGIPGRSVNSQETDTEKTKGGVELGESVSWMGVEEKLPGSSKEAEPVWMDFPIPGPEDDFRSVPSPSKQSTERYKENQPILDGFPSFDGMSLWEGSWGGLDIKSEMKKGKSGGVWDKSYAGRGALVEPDVKLSLVERHLASRLRKKWIAQYRNSNSNSRSKEFMDTWWESVNCSSKTGLDKKLDKLAVLLQERLPHLTMEETALVLVTMADVGYRNEVVTKDAWNLITSAGFCETGDPELVGSMLMSMGSLECSYSSVASALEWEVLKWTESMKTAGNISGDAWVALYLACEMASSKMNQRSLISGLVDFLIASGRAGSGSWLEVGVALKSAAFRGCLPVNFLAAVHKRVENGVDGIGPVESVVLMLAFSRILVAEASPKCLRLAEDSVEYILDHVENLDRAGKLDPALVPDLVYVMGVCRKPRTQLLESCGKLLCEGQLLAWVAVRKIIEGYSLLGYCDQNVMKMANEVLNQHGLESMSPIALSSLLYSGNRMQALDDGTLDKVMKCLESDDVWSGLHNGVFLSRIAGGLAGCERLTPEILTRCAKRCEDLHAVSRTHPVVSLDQRFNVIAHELFSAWHYIRHKHGAMVAKQCFSPPFLKQLLRAVRECHLVRCGHVKDCDKEISTALSDLEVTHVMKPVFEKGMYRADIGLPTQKVVMLIESPPSFSFNPPHRPLGRVLNAARQLRDLRIKPIIISEVEWHETPPGERTDYLIAQFKKNGVDLLAPNLKADYIDKEMENELDDILDVSEDEVKQEASSWLSHRMLVLNDLKKDEVKEILEDRGLGDAVKREFRKKQKSGLSKCAMINALIAHEGKTLFSHLNEKRVTAMAD